MILIMFNKSLYSSCLRYHLWTGNYSCYGE